MLTPALLSFHNYLKSGEDFAEKLITEFKFFNNKFELQPENRKNFHEIKSIDL